MGFNFLTSSFIHVLIQFQSIFYADYENLCHVVCVYYSFVCYYDKTVNNV